MVIPRVQQQNTTHTLLYSWKYKQQIINRLSNFYKIIPPLQNIKFCQTAENVKEELHNDGQHHKPQQQ